MKEQVVDIFMKAKDTYEFIQENLWVTAPPSSS